MAISPFTVPGTKIICVDDGDHGRYTDPHMIRVGGMDGLKAGEIYTVERIEYFGFPGREMLACVLVEIRRVKGAYFFTDGFSLERFNLAALPKAILDCLDVQRVDA